MSLTTEQQVALVKAKSDRRGLPSDAVFVRLDMVDGSLRSIWGRDGCFWHANLEGDDVQPLDRESLYPSHA